MFRREISKKTATALWLLLVFAPPLFHAESAEGDFRKLLAELTKYYRLSTAGLGAGGAAEILPGQVLTLKREGVVGFAEADQAMEDICPAIFRGGESRTEKSTLCSLTAGHSARRFHVADTLCVTSIKASAEQDSVSMYVAACSGGRRVPATHSYYALLVFQFAKGYLHTASAAKVEEAINQVVARAGAEDQMPPATRPTEPKTAQNTNAVPAKPVPAATAVPEPPAVPALPPVPAPVSDAQLAPANSAPAATAVPEPPAVPALPPVPAPVSDAQPAPGSPAPAATTVPEPAAVPALPPVPAPVSGAQPGADNSASPATPVPETPAVPSVSSRVSEGQSAEEVKAILGEPNRIADLGSKVIFFYPRLKIVFAGGKVSKVDEQENNQ